MVITEHMIDIDRVIVEPGVMRPEYYQIGKQHPELFVRDGRLKINRVELRETLEDVIDRAIFGL